MPPFETIDRADLSTFTVLTDGSEALVDQQVEYIDVRHSVNKISYAEISLIDGDAALQTFALSESEKLAVGSKIEIKLGYNNDNKSVFTGVIVSQQVKLTSQGHARTILHCKHACFVLAEASQTQYFSDINAPDLIKNLCSDFGVNMRIDTSQSYTPYEQLTQFRQSAWDYIGYLATKNNLMMSCEDDALTLIEYVQSVTSGDVISYGDNVLDANLELDIRGQFTQTASKSWSDDEQTLIEAQATASSSPLGNMAQADLAKANGNITQNHLFSNKLDQAHLDMSNKAHAVQQTLQTIVGTITVLGQSQLKVGDSVSVEGFGARFNGNAWVSGVMHSLVNGTWTSTIQVGRPKSAVAPFQQSNTSSGGHIGKVTGLEGDETGAQRIKVDLVIAENQGEGLWARLASQDAGENRGALFIPQIGDEVVLSFVDDDPSQALVIGSLYSAAYPMHQEISDDNPTRGFKTPSELSVTLNEEDKSISLSTPEGNAVMLNEDSGSIEIKDQNGNEVILDSNGITIKSSGDVSIECPGDFTVDASKVEIAGTQSASVEGGSSAELKASGTLKIEGAMVQIN